MRLPNICNLLVSLQFIFLGEFEIKSSQVFFFFYEIYLFFNKFNLKITKHNYTKVKIITITVIALT